MEQFGTRAGLGVTPSRHGVGTGNAMTRQRRDPAGSADLIYRSAARGAPCWARNHRGQVRALPMSRWMGGPDTTAHDQQADEYLLALCSGPATLDVGCGPGRFVAALHHCGRAALGVDSSAVAVELTRRRGGVAIRGDLFDPLPAPGCWDQVLLADGNIGIGGDPVATLRRATEMLAPGGVVIVEIDPPTMAMSQELLRWETDDHVGHWFPWSRVGATSLGPLARHTGLAMTSVVDIHSRVIAVLTPMETTIR